MLLYEYDPEDDVFTPFVSESMIEKVEEFHSAAGHPRGVPLSDTPSIMLAKNLIDEEYHEFMVALNEARFEALVKGQTSNAKKAALLKELCDLIWVSIDFAHTVGFLLEEAFEIVYESNMSKIDPTTFKPYETDPATGKVKKGPHYQPANLEVLFGE